MYAGEESGKSCCGVMVTQTVSIRWFIVMIAFVGICCAVVGTVLGAMRTSGREHLTVSLLMIGTSFFYAMFARYNQLKHKTCDLMTLIPGRGWFFFHSDLHF